MPSASAGDITIDSSHETSEQIQSSLDLSNIDSPETETSDPAHEAVDAPVQAEASIETPDLVDQSEPVEAESKKTTQQRRRKDATSAVQVAVGKQREAERRAVEAEDRLAEIIARAQPAPEPTKATTDPGWLRYKTMPGAPKVQQFEEYEDYTMAQAAFVTDVRSREHATFAAHEASRAAEQEAERVRESGWQERLKAAREADPTFDDRLDSNTPMSMPMQHLARESPVGTELLQYLSAHQDESQRLSTLHPVEVYREMGKLEERLGAASTTRGSAPIVSHAKPPIKPLRSSPYTPATDTVSDDMSFDEHFRRMNASDRKHGRL